ncbi:MAG TPA: hypothetical protein VJ894_01150 [Cryomorphaceae bacterium]|nr:hypothetical protein [Cryomorphaceae bacterium]
MAELQFNVNSHFRPIFILVIRPILDSFELSFFENAQWTFVKNPNIPYIKGAIGLNNPILTNHRTTTRLRLQTDDLSFPISMGFTGVFHFITGLGWRS